MLTIDLGAGNIAQSNRKKFPALLEPTFYKEIQTRNKQE